MNTMMEQSGDGSVSNITEEQTLCPGPELVFDQGRADAWRRMFATSPTRCICELGEQCHLVELWLTEQGRDGGS